MGSQFIRALALAFVAALAGSCVDPYGNKEAFREGTEVAAACKVDLDCMADNNPCTREVCDAPTGRCAHKAQDLPFGDARCDDANPCTDDLCASGACAHAPASAAPTDGNECTNDACVNGAASHTNVADGAACGLGGMLQCVNGSCNCTSAVECGQSTECLKFECTNSQCKSTSLPAGTTVDGKAPGDCLKNVCDGTNAVITVPDLTDVPADPTLANCKKKACDEMLGVIDVDDPADAPPSDGNVCTNEGCSGGAAILYEPVADGSPCGNGPTCGPAAGGGFQAVAPDACVSGTCVTKPAVSCGLSRCDGANMACLAACVSNSDCIAGAFCDPATNTCKPVAGTGNSCINSGECASGQCVDGVCCNAPCNSLCERCNDPASKGLCVAIKSGMDPDNECGGGAACNGVGQCGQPQGAACAMDVDCLTSVCEDGVCCNAVCSGACKRCDIGGSNGTCANVALATEVSGCTSPKACDGMGGCRSQLGAACGSDAECLSGMCQDGVCCNTACAGACARCDIAGAVGTCTNVPAGLQVSGCNATNACDGANNCKKLNGQACTAASQCVSGFCVDEDLGAVGIQGICCDSACTGTCRSCSGGKTNGGVSGICDSIKLKSDPDSECQMCNPATGKGCCDGAGTCNPP